MSLHQQHLLSSALLVILCAIILCIASAFTPTPAHYSYHGRSCNQQSKLPMSSFFADATPPRETVAVMQRDTNGNVITVGQKVVVVPNNKIKAHHVAKSCFGSFDINTKQFIPQDEANVTRKTSCLLIPEGLQGEVIKLHDTNGSDRTHPVVVKFGLDEDRTDGYTLPKAFTMHFAANEIMVEM